LHVAGGRVVVADYDRVLLLDPELAVERVLLHRDNDDDDDDGDDGGTSARFSRPLRLSYSPRRLLVACRSQFVNVYSWRPSAQSSALTDSPTRPET